MLVSSISQRKIKIIFLVSIFRNVLNVGKEMLKFQCGGNISLSQCIFLLFGKSRTTFFEITSLSNICEKFTNDEINFDLSSKKTKKTIYILFVSCLKKIQYISFWLFPVAYPFRIVTHFNITSSARNVG